MRYTRISLFVVMFLLCSVVINAVGQAGKPYNFFDVEKCYGDIKVRVYPLTMSEYSLVDCSVSAVNEWSCPCKKELFILTPNNTVSRFSALVQYNIGPPKNFTPSADGTPTQEEVYNDQLKRIYTIKDITINPKNETEVAGALSDNESINNILLTIVIVFGALIFLVFIVIVVFWLFNENLRRWLGLKEEEKITFGKIIRRMFTREDISRKTLVRSNGKVLPKIVEVKPQPQVKKEEDSSNVQDEVRKILEGLE